MRLTVSGGTPVATELALLSPATVEISESTPFLLASVQSVWRIMGLEHSLSEVCCHKWLWVHSAILVELVLTG
eukprot:scaffold124855_cov15-Tisochrysis_lutea.AAC.1